MGETRVRHSAELKAKVALEALKGLQTVNELAGQYQVQPTQISQWKRQDQGGAKDLFASGQGKASQEAEAVQAKLYEEVGRLKKGIGLDEKNCRARLRSSDRGWCRGTHSSAFDANVSCWGCAERIGTITRPKNMRRR